MGGVRANSSLAPLAPCALELVDAVQRTQNALVQGFQRCSEQTPMAEVKASLSELALVVVPERLLPPEDQASTQESIITGHVVAKTTLKLLPSQIVRAMSYEKMQHATKFSMEIGGGRRERPFPISAVSQNLVNEAEVTGLQKRETYFRVAVDIGL